MDAKFQEAVVGNPLNIFLAPYVYVTQAVYRVATNVLGGSLVVQNPWLIMLTLIGAYGGFPAPPPIIQWLFNKGDEKSKFAMHRQILRFLVQYSLLAILAYQGMGGQKWIPSCLAVLIFYIVHIGLWYASYLMKIDDTGLHDFTNFSFF